MSSKTSSSSSSKALNRKLEAKLAAFDDDESSDDEAQDNHNDENTSLSFLKNVETKLPSKKTDASSSVIYLGHLPVAFEEYELRGFLSQFGDIQNLRVARSKKTSGSKGYAFVEFQDAEVASIVAETMGGYLLLEKRLVCHVVPPEKVHPRMFHGGNNWKRIDWRKKHRDQVNQNRSAAKLSKITQRLQSREKKKREKLKELGIDYDFPGYSAAASNTTEKEEVVAQKEEEPREEIEKDEDTLKSSSSSTKKRRKLSLDDGEKETKSSSKKKKKKRKDSNASQEETNKSDKETTQSLKKKMRKDYNAEDDEEPDKSEKETKTSLKKKKRKNSNASHEETATTTTPDPKGDSKHASGRSETDVMKNKKKKKKKKSDKKRRVSAP